MEPGCSDTGLEIEHYFIPLQNTGFLQSRFVVYIKLNANNYENIIGSKQKPT